MAEKAVEMLTAAKAKVKLRTYEGGHGWKGDPYERVREGIEWLEKNRSAPSVRVWAPRRTKGRR